MYLILQYDIIAFSTAKRTRWSKSEINKIINNFLKNISICFVSYGLLHYFCICKNFNLLSQEIMLTEKAIEYNSFLSEVFDHINNFQVMVEFNNYTKGGIEKLKEIYSIDELNKRRDSFKEEVEINIAEYQEKDIIDEYFLTTLSKWINWEGFEFDYNQNIIKSGIEVNYLLKLKIEFEKQVYHLIDFANFRRPKGEYTNTFIEFFDTVMRKINSTNFSQKFEDFINELDNPKKYMHLVTIGSPCCHLWSYFYLH